jgi:hypothetical protein
MDMVQVKLGRDGALRLLLHLRQAALSLDRGLNVDDWKPLVAYFGQYERRSDMAGLARYLESRLARETPIQPLADGYAISELTAERVRNVFLGWVRGMVLISQGEAAACVSVLKDLTEILGSQQWPGAAAIARLRVRLSNVESILAARSKFIIPTRGAVEHFN